MEVADSIVNHCTINNIPLPNSVAEYKALKLYGLQTSVLSLQGIKCTDAIRLAREKIGIDTKLAEDLRRLNALNNLIKFLDNSSFISPNLLSSEKITRLSQIHLICTLCDNEQKVTLHSLIRRANNLCKFCSDIIKSKISSRTKELQQIAEHNNCSVLNVTDTTIDLKCNKCNTTSESRTLKHFYYRKSFSCEICSPIVRFGRTYLSTKLTKFVDGIAFDSCIEAQTYLLLKSSLTIFNILHHIKYSDLGCDTEIKYEADFLINNKYVLEVSTFQEVHHQKYFEKIKNKEDIINSCTKYVFIFCNSLADVKRFILSITK